MELDSLGFSYNLQQYLNDEHCANLQFGRVIVEHKERYLIKSPEGEFEGEITGNMRFGAQSRMDFPAVGDWVAFQPFSHNTAIIHEILPRKTVLSRQAVGKYAEKQIIAANIDVAFIVQSVDQDFNINRLERYLSLCYAAEIEPQIILSKVDLISDTKLSEILSELKSRSIKIEPFLLNNNSITDIEKIKAHLQLAKTYCFIGSSGVGKSTLINNLTGANLLETSTISVSTGKGRHTTSYRQLVVLEQGAILIDTPGMREIGMIDDPSGLETTFEDISALAENCKFTDCSHTGEKGCAVLAALDNGVISQASLENYRKMQREQQRFTATIAEKRKKDRVQGKMYKTILQNKNKTKY